MSEETKIRVTDSIMGTQQKRLEKIKEILPKNLIVNWGYYNDNDLVIGEPFKAGFIFKYVTYKTPLVTVTYTNVKVRDKKYFDLGMKIAAELGMTEVEKDYYLEKTI